MQWLEDQSKEVVYLCPIVVLTVAHGLNKLATLVVSLKKPKQFYLIETVNGGEVKHSRSLKLRPFYLIVSLTFPLIYLAHFPDIIYANMIYDVSHASLHFLVLNSAEQWYLACDKI